jgi:restriction system protein
MTYRGLVENEAETAANSLVCLIRQTNYLPDQQLRRLEQRFLEEGGFTEKLYRARTEARKTR